MRALAKKFQMFALHHEERIDMLTLISNLVTNRGANFREKEFLAYLDAHIPCQERKEIVRASSELKLIKSLSGKDLLAPLDRHVFPKKNLYDLLCVFHNTIIGAKLEKLFNPYQKLYLATCFLHSHRANGDFVDVADEAIALVLEDVFNGKAASDVGGRFASFLFYICRLESNWQQLNGRSYFALLGILLVLLHDRQHESDDFHTILEYLYFCRITNPGFIPESHSANVVQDWRSLTESVLSNAPDFRDAVILLLPH